MAIRTSERVERPETLRHSRLNSVSSQFSDGPVASPSTRSSTSSWCEEPVPSNMDISTGHMILVRNLLWPSETMWVVCVVREERGWNVGCWLMCVVVRPWQHSSFAFTLRGTWGAPVLFKRYMHCGVVSKPYYSLYQCAVGLLKLNRYKY